MLHSLQTTFDVKVQGRTSNSFKPHLAQRLHVPRREACSEYVPSAHFTQRDCSFWLHTVENPAGHFLQAKLINFGETG